LLSPSPRGFLAGGGKRRRRRAAAPAAPIGERSTSVSYRVSLPASSLAAGKPPTRLRRAPFVATLNSARCLTRKKDTRFRFSNSKKGSCCFTCRSMVVDAFGHWEKRGSLFSTWVFFSPLLLPTLPQLSAPFFDFRPPFLKGKTEREPSYHAHLHTNET